MLRILSWSSGLGCDKVATPDYSMVMGKEQPSTMVASVPLSPPVKRKRSPSVDVSLDDGSPWSSPVESAPLGTAQSLSAERMAPVPKLPTAVAAQVAMDGSLQPAQPGTVATPSLSRLDKMRQTISSQISLEILLKHKELRLIEQEMAKCQVALEQLRRCTEIPYPCLQAPSVSVTQGSGPAIRRLGQQYPPESPAPWGVTDGPYSRHYAKWLLEDRRFDGGEPEPELVQPLSAVSASGRSTRGHYVDVLGGKSVKARNRHSVGLQALPAGYGQPKEKATGPMILKRKSDNKMVKLVCPDCGRHDFGSAQGFINHCRIGHSRSFASHDAAAEACGEPVEYNDNGSIKGLEIVVTNTPTNTSVHPLVRSAKLMSQSAPTTPSACDTYVPGAAQPDRPSTTPVSPDFQASAQTPHLSILMQSQGRDVDLQHLVLDATMKAELPESDSSEDDMDPDSPVLRVGGRHPQVAGSMQPMKSSMSNAESSLLDRTRLAGTSSHATQSTDARTRDSFCGVLPSPTNDSTQAPSLVDDDEEFEPQSPVSSGEADEADVDFEVHDDEHADRVSGFQTLSAQPPTTCSPTPTATATTPTTRRGLPHAEKHVTFVSPSPAPEGSDRKRRKI